MKPGAIRAENVSRRFRVHPQRAVTLKEAVVKRRQLRPIDIWALRDVSLDVQPGEAVGVIGRNGSGKTTLLRLVAGIFRPTSGELAVGGSVGSLLELGAGFHPEFTGRENVYLNGAIHGLGRRFMRERLDEIVAFAELERFIDLPVRTYSAGMYMRLGFAIATHLDADVLLLDEVFTVGDEAFQRKCFGKIFEFKTRGGTILFVSHSAASVESLCERAVLLRAGRLEHDGVAHEAIARYHALLAEEEEPVERGSGLAEWGSGEVRVAEVRLGGADGNERRQFLSGEPLVVELTTVGEQRLAAPPRISLELRDANGGLLAAALQDGAELPWGDEAGERRLRFELERLRLSAGRFHVSVALATADGTHVYHRVERAADLHVYSEDDNRAPIVLEGQWSLASRESGVEVT